MQVWNTTAATMLNMETGVTGSHDDSSEKLSNEPEHFRPDSRKRACRRLCKLAWAKSWKNRAFAERRAVS